MFKPIKSEKKYQLVIKQIQEMVLNGSLKKGDKLPSERTMADDFEVSRASIREALRALEIIGIVECKQGGGNYIRSSFDHHLFEPLSIIFKLNNGSFKEILEYRMIFEPTAAKLAAQNIKNPDKIILKNLITRLQETTNNDEINAKIDQEIHAKIIDISGNYLMKSTMLAISVIMESFIIEAREYLHHWQENKNILIQLHYEMCMAIINEKPNLAMKHSQKHFEFLIDNLLLT